MSTILQAYLILDHWRKQLEELEELEGEAEARGHVVVAAWLGISQQKRCFCLVEDYKQVRVGCDEWFYCSNVIKMSVCHCSAHHKYLLTVCLHVSAGYACFLCAAILLHMWGYIDLWKQLHDCNVLAANIGQSYH